MGLDDGAEIEEVADRTAYQEDRRGQLVRRIQILGKIGQRAQALPQGLRDLAIGCGNRSEVVVEGDRAKERDVKLGSKYGEMMEIIQGVTEGEKVVAIGQQNLSEGAKVSVQQATPASSESGVRSSETNNKDIKAKN